MAIQIFNSLSQKKEVFSPLEPGKVKLYVCGPTVYGLLHIGNFRGPVFFNLVRKWLEYHKFDVTYVYNYTDVDDKIIDRAQKEGVSSKEISEKYIAEFKKDFSALKLEPHDKNPKVTEYIPQIIAMIERLIQNGVAYVVDGEVLYSVRKFSEYGKLSHRNIDDLKSGARVEAASYKQDPLDFSLWKPAKPNEPSWESPWGAGRPGWHIECSAMAHSIHGDQIDIHGGGMDLVFPHHENEIAQSEASSGKHFAKYWMHNNMLTFGDKKMSKSLGNIMTARDFLTQYNAEILKYMLLSVHYRSLSDFSEKAIENAISGLARIYSALALAYDLHIKEGVHPGKVIPAFEAVLKEENQNIENSLDDDFNTPEVFASFFKVVRAFNTHVRYGMKMTPEVKATALAFEAWIRDKGTYFSLLQEDARQYLRLLDDMLLKQKNLERRDIDAKLESRVLARQQKNFAESDRIRDELIGLGIKVFDGPQGSFWEVEK